MFYWQVRHFLRSRNWDTRVAAAQATGAIAENVKHLTVKDLLVFAEAELLDDDPSCNLLEEFGDLDDESFGEASLTFRRYIYMNLFLWGFKSGICVQGCHMLFASFLKITKVRGRHHFS